MPDDEHRPSWSPLLGPDEFPPLSALVQVRFGAASERGRQRVRNGDHHLVLRLGRHQETIVTSLPPAVVPVPFEEFGYAMVVADGGGEAGSRLALCTLVHLVLHFGKWNLRINPEIAQEVMDRAERFYRQVDRVVNETREAYPRSAGIETTMTGLFSAGRDCFLAHVGHSRGYLYRDSMLLPLTRDHTVDSPQTPALRLAPVSKDLQHILTDCIGHGTREGLTVDVEQFRLLDEDRLLLCTNGLTDTVSTEEIEKILSLQATPDRQCHQLVDKALELGAPDDVTAVIAHYCIPA